MTDPSKTPRTDAVFTCRWQNKGDWKVIREFCESIERELAAARLSLSEGNAKWSSALTEIERQRREATDYAVSLRGDLNRILDLTWGKPTMASDREVVKAICAIADNARVRPYPGHEIGIPQAGKVISHYDDEAGNWVFAENWHAIEGPNGLCACGPEKGKCGDRLAAFVAQMIPSQYSALAENLQILHDAIMTFETKNYVASPRCRIVVELLRSHAQSTKQEPKP